MVSAKEVPERGPLLNPIELAWAAGFFDGEGNVTFIPSARKRRDGSRGTSGQMRVQLAQVRREPLDRFAMALGGMGSVTGPYVDHRDNHNSTYRYCASANLAFVFIWNCLSPYLSAPKLEQFHEAWDKARLYYAGNPARRNDPRRLPPEPLLARGVEDLKANSP